MNLTAVFIADAASAPARSSTSAADTSAADLIGIMAVAEGMALTDLFGQVETNIDTLPASCLPDLSGAIDSRLQSTLQPLAAFSLGLVSVSLLALSTEASAAYSIALTAFALNLLSKMSLTADLAIST